MGRKGHRASRAAFTPLDFSEAIRQGRANRLVYHVPDDHRRDVSRNLTGFTLIELVIVIAIIGILAAVALPKFLDLRTEAFNAQQQAVVAAVRSGIIVVAAKNAAQTNPATGQFPPNLEAPWGVITGGTQPGSFPSVCGIAASCFELILSQPVTDGSWSQTGATAYTFTHPISSVVTTYSYSTTTGTFQ